MTSKKSAYVRWIETRPCAVAGRVDACSGSIVAHHVRTGTGGGTGMKPDDKWCIPLCDGHHMALHSGGIRTFERRFVIDTRRYAEWLQQTWENRE